MNNKVVQSFKTWYSTFLGKVISGLLGTEVVMYIMSVVIELRRLRKLNVESAQRITDLARGRRKEQYIILGIKKGGWPIAEVNMSCTSSAKVVVERTRVVKIAKYAADEIIMRVLMRWRCIK